MLRRGLGRLAALRVVLGTVMIGGAGAASAHAVLVATTPAGLQVLDAAPRAVPPRFSEPVDRRGGRTRGPGGRHVHGELARALRRLASGVGGVRLIGSDHAIGRNAPVTRPGRWELAVTIRTSEIDQTVVRVPVGAR